jgi:cysteine-rich repeat protein
MSFAEDFCLTPGTEVTFTVCEDIPEQDLVSLPGYVGTDGYTRAVYTVPLNFLQILEGYSEICFKITYPELYLEAGSVGIFVTPIYCGDGICRSAEGENCENCVEDCGCNTAGGFECLNGNCVGLCDLTSATWNVNSILEGNQVRLNLVGDLANCTGKTINFEVWEKDGGVNPDDQALPGPASITYGSPNTYGTWNAVFQDDTDWFQTNPPEYYFIASVSGYPESIPSSNINDNDPLLLRVTQPPTCPNTICAGGVIENCSNCIQDCPCPPTQVCTVEGTCINECVLSNPVWDRTDAVEGEQVQLTVTGNYCNGQTVDFEVREDDSPLGTDAVQTNPLSVTMSSGLATGTWTAEWPDVGGETAPEYYFIADINVLGKTVESSRSSANELHVGPNLYCGDCIISSSRGETCDDNNNVSGDGCSSSCTVEPKYSCIIGGMGCSMCYLICGNGDIDSGEQCDGINLDNKDCADILGNKWTGTPSCFAPGTVNECQFDPSTCIAPPLCTINSASWNESVTTEDYFVELNILTSNCDDGENVSFVVEEYDTGLFNGNDPVLNNPVNAIVTGNIATGIWQAEWQDDSGGTQENPPEYLFTATIVSNGEKRESLDPKLIVNTRLDAMCLAIHYCGDYTNETACNDDENMCDVARYGIPGVTCGGVFNPLTRCYDMTNCGCLWDSVSGVCDFISSTESLCGVCGNSVTDFGEQCDDGNLIDGDACSSICKFESDIPIPCPYGTALCLDNVTCSKNCFYNSNIGVAGCNYNTTCDAGEGCTCSDCNLYADTCDAGLICTIFNAACCNAISDLVCDPECSYVDPDCTPSVCGNGYLEIGEECDLGIKNGVVDSGCDDNCKLQTITAACCTEGTAECTDTTCSLNCYATDRGIIQNNNCCAGLVFSPADQACCKAESDGYCNPYCHYVDQDCRVTPPPSTGFCSWEDISTDTCERDLIKTRMLNATWSWAEGNNYTDNQSSADYIYDSISGVWRYDPLNPSGERRSSLCAYLEDDVPCPAQIEISVFTWYNFIIAIIVIILIYIIFSSKKKKKSKNKRKK